VTGMPSEFEYARDLTARHWTLNEASTQCSIRLPPTTPAPCPVPAHASLKLSTQQPRLAVKEGQPAVGDKEPVVAIIQGG
jgi:hypothetical protein